MATWDDDATDDVYERVMAAQEALRAGAEHFSAKNVLETSRVDEVEDTKRARKANFKRKNGSSYVSSYFAAGGDSTSEEDGEGNGATDEGWSSALDGFGCGASVMDTDSGGDENDSSPGVSFKRPTTGSATTRRSFWDPALLVCDVRKGDGLTDGLTVQAGAGVEPALTVIEQDDGSQAVALPLGGRVEAKLDSSHGLNRWSVEDDGRVHRYTVVMAVKLDRLPRDGERFKLLDGGAGDGKGLDNILIHPSGGVGSVGNAGKAGVTIKADRWTWVAVTRREGELHTIVNGRLCATIKLEDLKADGPSHKKPGDARTGAAANNGGAVAATGDAWGAMDNNNPDGHKIGGGKGGSRRSRVNTMFTIDPKNITLFEQAASGATVPDGASGQDEAGISKSDEGPCDAGPRPLVEDQESDDPVGVEFKFVSIYCDHSDDADVVKVIRDLRSTDEAADDMEEFHHHVAQELSLQPLYARPPPIWLHPAFAAEFGDCFCDGTGLEAGSLHTSLEVYSLVLKRLLHNRGIEALLGGNVSHSTWQALNSAYQALSGAKQTAERAHRALISENQQRMFMSSVSRKLQKTGVGQTVVLPAAVRGQWLLFVVERTEQEHCRFTVVSSAPELLDYHPRVVEPPTVKYKTCLSLGDKVAWSKICDEAFWGFVWYAAQAGTDPSKQRFSSLRVLYEVALPFLKGGESSVEDAGGTSTLIHDENDQHCDYRDPQISASTSHYRCLVEALHLLLRAQGVGKAECARIELLIRIQFLELTAHDLSFLPAIASADRAMIHLACRHVAYAASKLGDGMEDNNGDGRIDGHAADYAARMAAIKSIIDSTKAKAAALPSADADSHAPPAPLVLCDREAKIQRVSVHDLVGGRVVVRRRTADPSSTTGDGGQQFETVATRALWGTDAGDDKSTVYGFYFSASWCPPCKRTTPLLAAAHDKLRRQGKSLHIVFISSDKTEAAFERYYGKLMPETWAAVPYDSSVRTLLGQLYKVEGIPTLVLVDGAGKTISVDGLRLLTRHPQSFPWKADVPPETPHLHPGLDRLVRRGDPDLGPERSLGSYIPIDFLQQPQRVRTFDEAVEALRRCDKLATLIAVQTHIVKNTAHLIIALVQHTFTQVLPMPLPEGAASQGDAGDSCLWSSATLRYAQQFDMLVLLQRIMEHFVASVFAVDHSRELDAVRMVVPTCIAAVADVIIRKRSTDVPSELCLALIGQSLQNDDCDEHKGYGDVNMKQVEEGREENDGEGRADEECGADAQEMGNRRRRRHCYGITAGKLREQAATVGSAQPELHVARSAVLDYFDSREEYTAPIFAWENGERIEKNTLEFLEVLCKELGFVTSDHDTPLYVADERGLVLKNFPEFRCYRDIAFYQKMMLNPDIKFHEQLHGSGWTQRHAILNFQLNFDHDPPRYVITAFNDHQLYAKPRIKRGRPAPTRRFPSLAEPSAYTTPYEVCTEDDVLHLWDLPGFGDVSSSGSGQTALGQQDSELLLGYLTVPYISIPLVTAFFATEDRIHSLQSRELQRLFDAVLFEPGAFLHSSLAGCQPLTVPVEDPEMLATAHGRLLNELRQSPGILLDSLKSLFLQALDLDTGSINGPTSDIVLYAMRLFARIDNFVSFVLNCAEGCHDSMTPETVDGIRGTASRLTPLSDGVYESLKRGRVALRNVMLAPARAVLLAWERKLVRECDGGGDVILDHNTRLLCSIHAHMLLLHRNCAPAEVGIEACGDVVRGFTFLNTRHKWNTGELFNDHGHWVVPESDLFEVLHVFRRKMVEWLATVALQADLDAIMEGTVHSTANTGLAEDRNPLHRWARIDGARCRGRFAFHSVRADAVSARSESVEVISGEKTAMLQVEVDAGLMQMTLRASHPLALPTNVAKSPDVLEIFGNVQMQACVVENNVHRKTYRLVGRGHNVAHYHSDHTGLPPLEHWREYFPEECFPSEKTWIPGLLEPVRQAYMVYPEPLEIYMPEDPIPADAMLAYLVGKQPRQTGVWLEIFLHRELRTVEVFRVQSYGRRFYRSLEYTSDARYCLHSMQPSCDHRRGLWPSWGRHQAGHPYMDSHESTQSTVVTRDAGNEENLSHGIETFIPARLLFGVLPAALLERWTFWQDEADTLRGYLKEGEDAVAGGVDEDAVIVVRMLDGGHVATHGKRFMSRHWIRDKELPPVVSTIVAIPRDQLQAEKDAVDVVLRAMERVTRERGMLDTGGFKASFLVCAGLKKIIKELAQVEFGHNSSPDLEAGAEEVTRLLNKLMTREESITKPRSADVVLPQLVDRLFEAMGRKTTNDDHKELQDAVVPSEEALKESQQQTTRVLIDLRNAPAGSNLRSLTRVLTRIENLSHVLAWADISGTNQNYKNKIALFDPAAVKEEDISVVQLPRLKLTFEARVDEETGSVRLYSVDHADLYISNQRDASTTALLRGIPHSLLLSDSNNELKVLVPSAQPIRPLVAVAPFSTELVLDRSDVQWYKALESPYYVYPVHVSLSFLYSTTLASAAYLLLLRYLNRDYKQVAHLVDTVSSDAELTKEEDNIMQLLNSERNSQDNHPDAHACRLKIQLACLDSPIKLPWDLTVEIARYIAKLRYVSAECRLSHADELALLRHAIVDPADRRRVAALHSLASLNLIQNRRSQLRALACGDVTCVVETLPMPQPAMVDFDRHWDASIIETDAAGVAAVLQKTVMKYSHSSYIHMESAMRWISAVNSVDFKTDVEDGIFLLLYSCFSGGTKVRFASAETGPSFAKLLLPMVVSKKTGDDGHSVSVKKSIFMSILTILARTPSMGPYLVGLERAKTTGSSSSSSGSRRSANSRSNDIWSGVPDSGEKFSELGRLVTTVREELLGLAMNDQSVLDRMLVRRVDQLTKERMCFSMGRFGRGDGGDTYAYSGYNRGGGWAGGRGAADLNAFTEALEKRCAEELQQLSRWPEGGSSSIGGGGRGRTNRSKVMPPAADGKVPSATNPVADTIGSLSSHHQLFSERWAMPVVSDHACGSRLLRTVDSSSKLILDHPSLAMSLEDAEDFASAPLRQLGIDALVAVRGRRARGLDDVDARLCFDITDHPHAQSKVAKDMQSRLDADMAYFATAENKGKSSSMAVLSDQQQQLVDVDARSSLVSLIEALGDLRQRDMDYVIDALPTIVETANRVAVSKSDSPAVRFAKTRFMLRQMAEQEVAMTHEFLLCLLVSSKGVDDLRTLNEFVSHEAAEEIFDLAVATVLHASRVGMCNRALVEARDLVKLLEHEETASEQQQRQDLAAAIKLKSETLAGLLMTRRHYVADNKFDPRFLLFEFSWNLVLRKAQVELVEEFMDKVRRGEPLVKQMLMGGGKTTVVGPLLTLMLGDGERLVCQTMPQALLEQTKATLRATFSSVMKKRVFRLQFDRSSTMTWQIVDKLEMAVRERGVVLATPTAIKSIQLKFLEESHLLADASRPHHPAMEQHVRALARVLELFRDGILIMDEVDLILHPLKSELNFPVGARHPLDFSPERWNLPIHILDAVYAADRCGEMSVPFQQSSRARAILRELADVVQKGYALQALQRSPHLILLNEEWYSEEMLPVMAKWVLLWLEANHVGGGLRPDAMAAYITRQKKLDGESMDTDADGGVPTTTGLDSKGFKMLNLASEWLRVYLPHCLQKIDRVSFGMLSTAEYDALKEKEPNMPRSRFKLAIPFLGKDVPSRASEFAHPDIIIGLTVLAYRYEGLRVCDFEKDIMALVRQNFEKEVGPYKQRKSSMLYHGWIEQAGGVVKGTGNSADAEDDRVVVVPLHLLKASNKEQMDAVYGLLRKLPHAIHWFLEQVIFPSFMQHQKSKLSASGEEVGGEMLFKHRLGFSGTPSDLLPLALGRCGYEKGSDGKMLHTLTDPDVVTTEVVAKDWTVRSLLRKIARSERHFAALIDTGALVTGMSNLEVARALLDEGLEWCDGVVFLDEYDEKRVLVRATGRVVKLAQCGIALRRRFAFYDQVHTTGMDIRHHLAATAVVTLGKDMVFRDYAQGAFRMRGIGKGQKIHVAVIPEVERLIQRQLAKSESGSSGNNILHDIVAWLVVNSMATERVQFDQLCAQNLANVWRKNAFADVIDKHRLLKVGHDEAATYARGLLGEALVVANRGSIPTKDALDGKIIVLLLSSEAQLRKSTNATLIKGLKTASERIGGEGGKMEVVYVGGDSATYRSAAVVSRCPWLLAVPHSSRQRRKNIRDFFNVTSEEDTQCVIIDIDGRVITRNGRAHIEAAESWRLADTYLDNRGMRDERRHIVELQRLLDEQADALAPRRRRIDCIAREISEAEDQIATSLSRFVGGSEQQLPPRLAHALAEAEAKRSLAENAVATLDGETVALTIDKKGGEGLENGSLLPPAMQVVAFALARTTDWSVVRPHIVALPKTVMSRQISETTVRQLRRMLGKLNVGEVELDGNEQRILLDWVESIIDLADVQEDVDLEQAVTSIPAVTKRTCEAVCALYGLAKLGDDAEHALALAVESVDSSSAADATGYDGCGDAMVDDHEHHEAVEALNKKVFRLRQFIVTLQRDMEEDAKNESFNATMAEQAVSKVFIPDSTNQATMQKLLNDAKNARDPIFRDACTALVLVADASALGDGSDPISSARAVFVGTGDGGGGDGSSDNVKNGKPKKDKGHKKSPGADRRWQTRCEEMAGMTKSIRAGAVDIDVWARVADLGTRIKTSRSGHSFPNPACQNVCLVAEWLAMHYAVCSGAAAKKSQLGSFKADIAEAAEQLQGMVGSSSAFSYLKDVDVTVVSGLRKRVVDLGLAVRRDIVASACRRVENDEDRALSLLVTLPKAVEVVKTLRQPGRLVHFAKDSVDEAAARAAKARLQADQDYLDEMAAAEQLDDAVNNTEEKVEHPRRTIKVGDCGDKAWSGLVLEEQPDRLYDGRPVFTAQLKGGKTANIYSMLDPCRDERRYWFMAVAPNGVPAASTRDVDFYTAPGEGNLPPAEGWGGSREHPSMRGAHPSPRVELVEADAAALVPPDVMREGSDDDDGLSSSSSSASPAARDDDEDVLSSASSSPPTSSLPAAEALVLRWVDQVVRLRSEEARTVPTRQRLAAANRRLRLHQRQLDAAVELRRASVMRAAARAGIPNHAVGWASFPWAYAKPRQALEDRIGQALGLRDETALNRLCVEAARLGLTAKRSYAVFQAHEMKGHLDSERRKKKRRGAVHEPQEPDPAGASTLQRALAVFLEAVVTDVPDAEPKRKRFADVLAERVAAFEDCVSAKDDKDTVRAILSLVADAAGLEGIETEQCREQEQEREAEQEQEQEIEMERYADLAYQRDGEEPVRWALATLKDPDAPQFYGASEFKLQGRIGLRFPTGVMVSRNHFNPDWAGDRRLKNASVAMAWQVGGEKRHVLLSLAEAETLRLALHAMPGAGATFTLMNVATGAAVDCGGQGSMLSWPQARVAYRFLDSARHYGDDELATLLGALPDSPVRRRIFFDGVAACRRRLGKRWEKTPLAAAFLLSTSADLHRHKAMGEAMGAAIRARGLGVQDAFALFDASCTGVLTPGEVAGALEWLGLAASVGEVAGFIRHLTIADGKPALSYGRFADAVGGDDDDSCAVPMVADGTLPCPKDEAELANELSRLDSEARREESALRQEEGEMAKSLAPPPPPKRFFEFGWAGEDAPALPLGSFTQGGKSSRVVEGGVSCLKLWPHSTLVLRMPPTRPKGKGWAVTALLKSRGAPATLPFVSTSVEDEFGAGGDGTIVKVKARAGRWQAITVVADVAAGVATAYVNGEAVATTNHATLAVTGRVALLPGQGGAHGIAYVRCAVTHSCAPSPAEVASEHAAFAATIAGKKGREEDESDDEDDEDFMIEEE